MPSLNNTEIANALYDVQVLTELLSNNIRTDNPRASELTIQTINSILCPLARHFEELKNNDGGVE